MTEYFILSRFSKLTEPFASDTGYLLTYVSQMAYLDFDNALEPLDIDARQYGVMTLIDNGTHRSQIAINEKLGLDRTHVVRLVHAPFLRPNVHPTQESSLLQRPSSLDQRSLAVYWRRRPPRPIRKQFGIYLA